jgi:hypothetical protein
LSHFIKQRKKKIIRLLAEIGVKSILTPSPTVIKHDNLEGIHGPPGYQHKPTHIVKPETAVEVIIGAIVITPRASDSHFSEEWPLRRPCHLVLYNLLFFIVSGLARW